MAGEHDAPTCKRHTAVGYIPGILVGPRNE